MFAPLLISIALNQPVHAADWPDLAVPAKRGPHTANGSGEAALIIAIEDYMMAQDLPGAVSNALAWKAYLSDHRGVGSVKILLNKDATREGMLAAAKGISERVEPGARLWVIYIGHGAPDRTGDGGLLVGVDAQQNAQGLESRSLRMADLEASLTGSPGEVLLIQDACFSGKASKGDLAPGLAPLKVVSADLGPKWTVLSAGQNDEYAGPLSDGSRPAFSYLVLGALRGWGDKDGDGEVTAKEAVEYASDAIYLTVNGRNQKPQHSGPDITLGRAGGEKGPNLSNIAGLRPSRPTVVIPDQNLVGKAEVDIGRAKDFAALAADATAKEQAAKDALRLQEEALEARRVAEAAIAAERSARLKAAKDEILLAATTDFDPLKKLIEEASEEAIPVFETYIARYDKVTVTIDGETERLEVPEVERARKALAKLNSGKMRTRTERRTIQAISAGTALGVGGSAVLVRGLSLKADYTGAASSGTLTAKQQAARASQANGWMGAGYALIGAGVVVGVGGPVMFSASSTSVGIRGVW